MNVRPVEWARDVAAIARIDTSFTTDRVYRFGREKGGFGFALSLLTTTPLTKSYPLPESDPGDGAFVAELDGEVAGFAQVESPSRNGRAAVQLYLAHGFYLCGLDESFYDPVELPGEFALFFSRPLF